MFSELNNRLTSLGLKSSLLNIPSFFFILLAISFLSESAFITTGDRLFVTAVCSVSTAVRLESIDVTLSSNKMLSTDSVKKPAPLSSVLGYSRSKLSTSLTIFCKPVKPLLAISANNLSNSSGVCHLSFISSSVSCMTIRLKSASVI